MIRNAVLHLFNEQPLVADLYRVPDPADVGLVCTNLRLKNGSRPVFIDEMSATFFIPYGQIRFVEIPAASMAAAGATPASGMPAVGPAPTALVPVGGAAPGEDGPVPGEGGVEGSDGVTAASGDATGAPGDGATGPEIDAEPGSDA